MFEMAKDEIVESQTYEIMAGYYSPVSSYYKKAGLAPAMDRVRMCELAVEHTSTWLMVDPWEAGQPEYQRTAVVLDHFDEMLNGADGRGGLVMSDGKRRKYKVMLLAGGDLIESFGEPGVWAEPDVSGITAVWWTGGQEMVVGYGMGHQNGTEGKADSAAAYHSWTVWLSDCRTRRLGRLGILALARYSIPSSVSPTPSQPPCATLPLSPYNKSEFLHKLR
jgi:hypothetical protein